MDFNVIHHGSDEEEGTVGGFHKQEGMLYAEVADRREEKSFTRIP